MSINSTASDGGASADGDDRQLVRHVLGDSDDALERAVAAIARVEREFGSASDPAGENRPLSERLVEVRRTLQEAGHVLDQRSRADGQT
jgi:hypothetical protein